jgi:HTH-type transcriptional regulator/antitoxin HigA
VGSEQKLFDDSFLHPGDILRDMIKEKGWTQDEFALITGRSRQAINEILSRRTGITPEMAVTLGAVFGNTPSEWMRWDAAYRIANIKDDTDMVRNAMRLYDIAPIRDMQKRGWIKDTKDPVQLEAELKAFFGVESIAEDPLFPVAMRKTVTLGPLTPAERAWCFRARQLARAIAMVAEFVPTNLEDAQAKLRELAAYPSEARHASAVLAEHGIRLVIVEPLPGTRVDGAAFWLDEKSPVVALSARFDRNDSVWHTLMHEFMHIKNGDVFSVDKDLVTDGPGATAVLLEEEIERRANEQAADALIRSTDLDSFMRRVSPLYSKERIVQFAHRVKIHPGIVVGQLQRKGEIGYSANREMLAKIRNVVTETALTDGWGKIITDGVI